MRTPKLLSLIIPAYKQEKTIKRDILRIKRVLDQIRYDYEIIIVVDGREDHTYQAAKSIASSKVRVLSYEENKGKGYAIRYGMVRSKGNIIAFLDSGMDIDPNGISMLLEHMEWYDADVIVGSKLHPVSKINYPWQRRILSWGYRLLVRILFGLSIRDTQAGIKIYKRKLLRDVLPRLIVKKFAFDIELLAVARSMGYKRIYEAPIELNFTGYSSVTSKSFWKIMFLMLWDTLGVYYRLQFTDFYKHKRSYIYKK